MFSIPNAVPFGRSPVSHVASLPVGVTRKTTYHHSLGLGYGKSPSTVRTKRAAAAVDLLCLNKHHALKMYGGVKAYLRAFLTATMASDDWFYPRRKSPVFSLNRRLRGPQWGSGYFAEDINVRPFGNITLISLAVQHYTTLTELQKAVSKWQ